MNAIQDRYRAFRVLEWSPVFGAWVDINQSVSVRPMESFGDALARHELLSTNRMALTPMIDCDDCSYLIPAP